MELTEEQTIRLTIAQALVKEGYHDARELAAEVLVIAETVLTGVVPEAPADPAPEG
jgi:hypothetical protein